MQNTQQISSEPRPSVQPSGFVPVAVDTLVSSTAYDFDLFMRQDRRDTYILYRARGYPLTKEDVDRLVERGIHTLHIAFEDRDAYTESLNDLLLEGGSMSPIQKYNLLKGAARSLFSDALCESLPDAFVDSVDALSRQMVSSICNDELVLRDMFFLMAHDYCSYTHATNVATYSLAIAMERGIRDSAQLIAIASGALLHDIGKRHLAPALLQKTATLSPEERARIREHPQRGFQELCFRPGICWGQLMMVYQHHERIDGTGYPVQLCGDEIHPWAKICSVADVFDALTSERPYRRAASASAALRYLAQRASKAFDQEIVQCLIRMLPEQLIAIAPCEIELPEEWHDFFAAAGPTPPSFDDSRRFPRFYLRRFAALNYRSTLPTLPRPATCRRVFLKDISRSSVAFLHSEQLFPSECVELLTPDGSLWLVTVARCLRHKDRCYEIAATFSGKPGAAAV